MSNFCVSCGEEIPEGSHICSFCRKVIDQNDDDRLYHRAVYEVVKIRGTSRYGVREKGSITYKETFKDKGKAMSYAASQMDMTLKDYKKTILKT